MDLQWRFTSPSIPPHRTQLHPRMQGFPSKPINNKTKVVISIAFVFMVPSIYYLFTTAQKVHQSSNFAAEFHGVVIDSGATVSRIHVFKWLGEEHLPFVEYSEVSNSKSNAIESLIDFARDSVPNKEWANTKVQLIVEEKNDVRLKEYRKLLRASGFAFKNAWARVSRRQEIGVYGWIAANHALGTLGAKPQRTNGILQIDTASMQVTFAVKEKEFPLTHSISFAGVTYNLYTQSFPQFGQDAAWEVMHELQNSLELKAFSNSSRGEVENPCIPKGYELTTNMSDKKLKKFHPAGNFSACRSEALSLLEKRRGSDKCLNPPCRVLSSFPELQKKPVSPENFVCTSEVCSSFLNTSMVNHLDDIMFNIVTYGICHAENTWCSFLSFDPQSECRPLYHSKSCKYLKYFGTEESVLNSFGLQKLFSHLVVLLRSQC